MNSVSGTNPALDASKLRTVIPAEQKKVRRAKLFYLRKKKGKAARLKERTGAVTTTGE